MISRLNVVVNFDALAHTHTNKTYVYMSMCTARICLCVRVNVEYGRLHKQKWMRSLE